MKNQKVSAFFRPSASISAIKKEEPMFLFFLRTGRDLGSSLHLNVAAVCIHLIVLQKSECQQNTHSLLNEHKVYELAE
jgi:hypothetical protein